jgi:excisionase family DNA binding protein
MHVEGTQLYRVRTVATGLDVSVATIYRAVESGALRAIRIGTGKGAVRIFGDALIEYFAECERAAATRSTTTIPSPAMNAALVAGGDAA